MWSAVQFGFVKFKVKVGNNVTVYGRQPSESTLQIFEDVIEAMKKDPMNRKAAEGMKHPPNPKLQMQRDITIRKSGRVVLRRIK